MSYVPPSIRPGAPRSSAASRAPGAAGSAASRPASGPVAGDAGPQSASSPPARPNPSSGGSAPRDAFTRQSALRPLTSPPTPTSSYDWTRVGALVGGIALGALAGAGIALMLAPQSGDETRLQLKRRVRGLRVAAEDRWDDAGACLRKAARQRRRQLRRKIARSRWAAADAMDR